MHYIFRKYITSVLFADNDRAHCAAAHSHVCMYAGLFNSSIISWACLRALRTHVNCYFIMLIASDIRLIIAAALLWPNGWITHTAGQPEWKRANERWSVHLFLSHSLLCDPQKTRPPPSNDNETMTIINHSVVRVRLINWWFEQPHNAREL